MMMIMMFIKRDGLGCTCTLCTY